MMAAALPVAGEDAVDVRAIAERMRLNIPPADVDEYLWRVRLEAERLPAVAVAAGVDARRFDALQTPNMPRLEPFAAADRKLRPSRRWKDALLADFAELRQLVARWEALGPPETETEPGGGDPRRVGRTDVPRMSDERGWETFFFGKASVSSDYNGGNEGDCDGGVSTGTPPQLRLLLQFDQVLTRRLLEYHTTWVEGLECVSRARAVWIYALLARLDKPVHATVAATIRQLLRRCWQLRSELGGPKSGSEGADAAAGSAEDDEDEELRLKSLNVLITIAGDFFGQLHNEDADQP